MNSRWKKTLGIGVMTILLAVCSVPALAGAARSFDQGPDRGFDRPGHHRPAFGIWRNPELVEKLTLTDTQVQALRKADFACREKRLEIKARLDRLHLQLDKAVSDDSIDDTAVLGLAREISAARGDLFVQAVESRLALAKILTADQIKTLKLRVLRQKKNAPRPSGCPLCGHHAMEVPDADR